MNTTVVLRKKEIEDSFKMLVETHQNKVRKIIDTYHSLRVGTVSPAFGSETVTLEIAEGEDRGTNLIEIHYRKGCEPFMKEEFTTNIAAMGEFNLLDGNKIAQYYIVVGEFLKQKGMLNKLKDEMENFCEESKVLREEYRILSKKD